MTSIVKAVTLVSDANGQLHPDNKNYDFQNTFSTPVLLDPNTQYEMGCVSATYPCITPTETADGVFSYTLIGIYPETKVTGSIAYSDDIDILISNFDTALVKSSQQLSNAKTNNGIQHGFIEYRVAKQVTAGNPTKSKVVINVKYNSIGLKCPSIVTSKPLAAALEIEERLTCSDADEFIQLDINYPASNMLTWLSISYRPGPAEPWKQGRVTVTTKTAAAAFKALSQKLQLYKRNFFQNGDYFCLQKPWLPKDITKPLNLNTKLTSHLPTSVTRHAATVAEGQHHYHPSTGQTFMHTGLGKFRWDIYNEKTVYSGDKVVRNGYGLTANDLKSANRIINRLENSMRNKTFEEDGSVTIVQRQPLIIELKNISTGQMVFNVYEKMNCVLGGQCPDGLTHTSFKNSRDTSGLTTTFQRIETAGSRDPATSWYIKECKLIEPGGSGRITRITFTHNIKLKELEVNLGGFSKLMVPKKTSYKVSNNYSGTTFANYWFASVEPVLHFSEKVACKFQHVSQGHLPLLQRYLDTAMFNIAEKNGDIKTAKDIVHVRHTSAFNIRPVLYFRFVGNKRMHHIKSNTDANIYVTLPSTLKTALGLEGHERIKVNITKEVKDYRFMTTPVPGVSLQYKIKYEGKEVTEFLSALRQGKVVPSVIEFKIQNNIYESYPSIAGVSHKNIILSAPVVPPAVPNQSYTDYQPQSVMWLPLSKALSAMQSLTVHVTDQKGNKITGFPKDLDTLLTLHIREKHKLSFPIPLYCQQEQDLQQPVDLSSKDRWYGSVGYVMIPSYWQNVLDKEMCFTIGASSNQHSAVSEFTYTVEKWNPYSKETKTFPAGNYTYTQLLDTWNHINNVWKFQKENKTVYKLPLQLQVNQRTVIRLPKAFGDAFGFSVDDGWTLQSLTTATSTEQEVLDVQEFSVSTEHDARKGVNVSVKKIDDVTYTTFTFTFGSLCEGTHYLPAASYSTQSFLQQVDTMLRSTTTASLHLQKTSDDTYKEDVTLICSGYQTPQYSITFNQALQDVLGLRTATYSVTSAAWSSASSGKKANANLGYDLFYIYGSETEFTQQHMGATTAALLGQIIPPTNQSSTAVHLHEVKNPHMLPLIHSLPALTKLSVNIYDTLGRKVNFINSNDTKPQALLQITHG